MNWQSWLLIIAAVALVAVGFMAARGCQDVARLQKRDAERVVEIERRQFLVKQADELRATHAERRNAAERELSEVREQNVELRKQIAMRPKPQTLKGCQAQLDESYGAIAGHKVEIDLLQAALDASKEETSLALDAKRNLEEALALQEDRAEDWKAQSVKHRRQKIGIGIGSALGGAGVMALAVYGAGQL